MSIGNLGKNSFIFLLKGSLLFVAVVMIGWVLLVAAYSIPTKNIAKHVTESSSYFVDTYPNPFSTEGARLDRFTDALLLLEAAYDEGDSAIRDSLVNPSKRINGMNPAEFLYNSSVKDSSDFEALRVGTVTYARYWHGSLIFLKPLLVFFKYGQILLINMLLQFCLLAGLIVAICVKARPVMTIPVLAFWLFINPITCALSLQFAPVLVITLVSLLLLTMNKDCYVHNHRYLYCHFLVLGMLTSYFDLLTAPLVTFGVSIVFWLLLGTGTIKDTVRVSFACVVTWGLGFFGMWASKWILATILTEQNVIQNALNCILERSGNEYQETQFTYWDVISRNISATNLIVNCLLIGIGLFICVYNLLCQVKTRYLTRIQLAQALPILFVALLPFIWYAFTQNHSYVHFWFTYRELSICVVSIFAFLVRLMPGFKPRLLN